VAPQPHAPSQPSPQPQAASQPPRPEATESAEAGVARARQILAAAANARWPMYLRNVKQILRQAEGGFDERRYGFGGLMDLLKALQRDGVVRIERDRRGGLRVFQGQALQQATRSQVYVGLPKDVEEEEIETVDAVPVEAQPGEVVATEEPADTEQPEIEPIPIDTTAELLGRRTRKPRARTPRVGAGAAREPQARGEGRTRKTAAKKPAARKSTRARKAAADAGADDGE
jgi:OST-HTH/LOTUS domain-containing protein